MMITNLRTPDPQKPVKRSMLGLLFNPDLGPAFSPLRESTRIFILLIATVFSLYKLIPKDYPGLHDQNAKLKLSEVMGTAWRHLRFTREGAPQIILFFAILGMMAFSGFVTVAALLSLCVGHAHAQPVGQSAFTAPSTSDVAADWLAYLFQGIALPQDYDQMGNSIPQGLGIQAAFTGMLAFYSDAILIVAAIILFYHLAAMVVETAHHGVPMGKRASQIWAPIRLVVAIGLLVPISGGLSCGQFIVVKMAAMGSNMASNGWNIFLDGLASYAPKFVTPPTSEVGTITRDMIEMQACMLAWNIEVNKNANLLPGFKATLLNTTPVGKAASQNGRAGTRYSYTAASMSVEDVDICGWYFIPTPPPNATTTQNAVYMAAGSAFQQAFNGGIATAAATMSQLATDPVAGQDGSVTLSSAFDTAAGDYETNLRKNFEAVTTTPDVSITQIISQMKPYGWVFAGAFLNTIDRLQAGIVSSSVDAMPITHPPAMSWGDEGLLNQAMDVAKPLVSTVLAPGAGLLADGQAATDIGIRERVFKDMQKFNAYVQKSQIGAVPVSSGAACVAMAGLHDPAREDTDIFHSLFEKLDQAAINNKIWVVPPAQACSGAATGNADSAFTVGIGQFTSADPFSEMTYLGHGFIKTALDFMAAATGGAFAGAALSGVPFAGGALGGGALMIAGFCGFIATILFLCGFSLAYVLPLMPFTRFFFSVLAWIGAILEAVIAVPLVALAHLNPEGEGLPGQAKSAYFFVFNIFLRPILTVFGLVCALMIFFIAVNFLNFAYNVAVSGAGGTAYGYETLSKLFYSAFYVVILYVCATHVFKLIDHLPQHAMSWLGASGQAVQEMGNVDTIDRYAQAAGGIVGNQAAQKLQGGAQQAGTAIGKGAGDVLGQKGLGISPQGGGLIGKMRDSQMGENGSVNKGQLKDIANLAKSSGRSVEDVTHDEGIMRSFGHEPGTYDADAVANEILKNNYYAKAKT